MHTHFACLFALLSTLVACGAPASISIADESVTLQPDDADAITTGFVPAFDERGQAWVWGADPSLRVTLSHDPTVPGLFIERGDKRLAVVADWGLGPTELPLLLVGPRSDGTEALAADPGPGLHLLLAGSAEHGCPANDLELDLLPRMVGDDVQLAIQISGMPYLALPADGSIHAVGAAGMIEVQADELCASQDDVVLSGFRWLRAQGSSMGEIVVEATHPLPWTQLQGHTGLVEFDVDHSCEANTPVTQAELTVTATL